MQASSLCVFLTFLLLCHGISSVLSQCSNTPPSCPATGTNTAVPSSWYNLTFNSAITGTNWKWVQADTVDVTACGTSTFYPTGLANLSVAGDSTTGTSYIDLTVSTGVQTAGTALPGIIGSVSAAGNVAAGTAGWTFEITFKPSATTSFGKVFSLGCGQDCDNIYMGWSGNTQTWQYGEYPGNTNNYLQTIASTLTLNRWYHMVVVIQQIDSGATMGNWFIYMNGVLLLNNNSAVHPITGLYPPSVARPNSYLGRSSWASDAQFQGFISTFRIYNLALVSTQVTALYSYEMGGCLSNVAFTSTSSIATPSNIYPNVVPSGTSVPTKYYSVTFGTDPRVYAGGTSSAAYGYFLNAPDDLACSAVSDAHTGVVELYGGDNTGTTYAGASYINMSAISGVNAITNTASSVFPSQIGGPTNGGTFGLSGWSIEITFKAAMQETWGYVYNIGQSRASSGNCQYDLTFGWSGSSNTMILIACDGSANQYQIVLQSGLTFIPNVWYHAVWSITDIGGGLSNWALYVNNQIYGILSATYFPPLVVRQNADLGRSGWVDSFWSGYVDNFAIYQTPVNSAQVALMYTAAMGPSGTAITCASTASTSSQIPASAIFFAAPFCTDPRQNTAIMSSPSLAQYSWLLHNTSNDAAGIHTGIIVLSGTTSQSGTNPQWIDLTTSTGAHSIGQTLGMLGGLGTGMISAGTVGWSFEVSVKSYVHLDWSKVFDLGDSSNQAYEIVIGWDGAASGYYGADVSLGSNAQTQDAFGAPVVVNTWYHIVWVIQYSLTNSSTSDLANYYLYVNGVLTNTFYSQNYPNYAQRVQFNIRSI